MITFDGENRLINLDNTSIVSTIDLYSLWKNWYLDADNSKYLPAFRMVGGEPLVGSLTSPTYVFLLNGWRVKTLGATTSVDYTVSYNLYTDDGTTPFITQTPDTVTSLTSDIPQIQVSSDNSGGNVNLPLLLDEFEKLRKYILMVNAAL